MKETHMVSARPQKRLPAHQGPAGDSNFAPSELPVWAFSLLQTQSTRAEESRVVGQARHTCCGLWVRSEAAVTVRDRMQTWGAVGEACPWQKWETGKRNDSLYGCTENHERCIGLETKPQRGSLQSLEVQKRGMGDGNSPNGFYKSL